PQRWKSQTGAATEGHPYKSSDTDPRVEPAIDHVCKQVRDDVSHADHQHAALHDAIVTFSDAIFDEQQSQARPAENLLRDDRAREQHTKLQTENRDDRNQPVLQDVFVNNGSLTQTLCARGTNIIF